MSPNILWRIPEFILYNDNYYHLFKPQLQEPHSVFTQDKHHPPTQISSVMPHFNSVNLSERVWCSPALWMQPLTHQMCRYADGTACLFVYWSYWKYIYLQYLFLKYAEFGRCSHREQEQVIYWELFCSSCCSDVCRICWLVLIVYVEAQMLQTSNVVFIIYWFIYFFLLYLLSLISS